MQTRNLLAATQTCNRSQRKKSIWTPWVCAIAMLLMGSVARAASYYYSGNGSAQGGTGTWDSTSANNWAASASGPFNHVWANANNDTAIFGGTAGAVYVTAPISVGGVVFNIAGYSFAGTQVELANGSIVKASGGLTVPLTGWTLASGNTNYRFGNLSTATAFANANVLTVSNTLGGASNCVEIVGGSSQPVYLTAANTYGGTTTVSDGAAVGFDTANLDGMGGGPSSRSILLGNNSSVLRRGGNLNNAFLQRLAFTTNTFTIYANNGGSGNALDLTGFPNASLATWDNVGTVSFAFSGTITPANHTYRFGGPRGGNYINLNNANSLTGSNSLVVVAGSISKLKLNAANDFTGTTLISSGTLYLANNLALQNSALDTSGGGTMDVTGATAPTFGGLLGSKSLGTLITGGYGSLTTLTLNPAAGATNAYSGVIADTTAGLALVKTGLGTQILSGDCAYSRSTTISNGTLRVNGSLDATSAVTVVGGTLRGTGTINGPVNVQAGGTLAPGDVVGTLNVSNVTLNGVLAIDIKETQPELCGTLAVSGNLNITGATLNLTFVGNTLQPEYVIATYDSLTGTFAAIHGLPSGWGLDYSYTSDAYPSGNAIAIVPPPPTAPPTVPAGLTATNGVTADGSISFVRLNWNPSSGAAAYNVKRSLTNGGPYTQIATTLLETYDDLQARVGVTNFYVVSAVNSLGESADSAQVSVVPKAPAAPPAPTGLAASSTNGVVRLAWNASLNTAGYLVRRGVASGGPYALVGTAAGSAYLDAQVAAGTTYFYVVAATNSGGISGNSAEASVTVAADPLLAAIGALKDYINGVTNLTADQIAADSVTIEALTNRFAESSNTIAAVFGLVRAYDQVKGPLWVATGSLTRSTDTNNLTWTIYHTMQGIMDRVYNPQTLSSYPALLDGFKFNSSSNFPGACTPPPTSQTYTVAINGSFPKTFGRSTQGWDLPARKPTGAYLAPGTLATVTVPPALVDKGYQVRVGAHSWDFSNKPSVARLDRSSLLYPISSTNTVVASPLGGGIYIEVPQLANAGVVSVTVTGGARSPFFSSTSFHQTTLNQWLSERTNAAPWADFQSDKFMMQVPRSWIYAFANPITLMSNWDLSMDACNDLMGFPHDRGKETMYYQVDLYLRASVYAPGYPTVNLTYNPKTDYGGNINQYLITGPQNAAQYVFHEEGHSYFFPKFAGETESAVNLLFMPVLNRKFGVSLDDAFKRSYDYTGNGVSSNLDNAAVLWMSSFDFSPRQVAMADWEKAYQPQGHAKFADLARLYGEAGWAGLGNFWHYYNSNDTYGVSYPGDNDSLVVRLCKSVGKDVRPLWHFWGIIPSNPANIAAQIAGAGLTPPVEIYDLLVRYKSLLPTNNASYQSWCLKWYGKQPSINGYGVEREHARQWSTNLLNGTDTQQRYPTEIYDEAAYAQVNARAQAIIDLYYPNGRPVLPAVPSGLVGTGSNALVKLTWNPASGATGYKLQRGMASGGPYGLLATTGLTNYNDLAVTNGITYYYVVAATNVFGASGNSAEVSVKPMAPVLAPPVLSGYAPGSGGSFGLTFSGPSGQSYRVLSSTNLALSLTNWTVLTSGTFGGSPVNYTDTGATNARQFYRITSP